jgi:hypothetical protein
MFHIFSESDYEESSSKVEDSDGDGGDSADNSDEGEENDEDDGGNMFPENDENKKQNKAIDFQHFSNTDKTTEVQKGSAVRNQLSK